QRALRADVAGRAAPGAALLRREVPRVHPALYGTSPREIRHDRLGAGERAARRHLNPGAHEIRFVVRRELVAVARHQDRAADDLPDDLPPQQERVLTYSLKFFSITSVRLSATLKLFWTREWKIQL